MSDNDMFKLADDLEFVQNCIQDLLEQPNPRIGKYSCRVAVLTGRRTCSHFSCRPPEKEESKP